MHCDECKQQLLELIYEEGVRPRRKLELLDHVDSCPMCHEEYTTLLESRALLQEWPDEDVSWSLRVDPNYQTSSPLRRWFPVGAWLQPSWPAARAALAGLLVLVAVLALTQSRITWDEGGLTVHARFWRNENAGFGGGMTQQDFLATVDRMIADSEQRQNKLFGTALIKVYEDLEVRHRYEYGEIQTAFDSLQKQNEARWERSRQTNQ